MSRWAGCYDGNWNGLIADEAFAHPAKFANGLINRIFDHLALPKGSIVVDPFGGVGLGGVVAASRGLQWFGCELEPKFVDLAGKNFELHRRLWEQHGDPLPVIVQGDSRQLRTNLAGVMADCVVSSPPFQQQQTGGGIFHTGTPAMQATGGGPSGTGGYRDQGSTPGNIANLKAGSVDAVVSSPPYSHSIQNTTRTAGGGRSVSPKCRELLNAKNSGNEMAYSNTPGNIANLPSGSVDAVVSSPPYEGSLKSESNGIDWAKSVQPGHGRQCDEPRYGEAAGNIGNQTGDTFWAAAADIVAECFAILRPGGVACWVCKDFVRKGQRVPFSDDWRKLCEAQGFVLTEWVHASLVKEDSHPSLFGDEPIVKKTERKSFFRRLAEKKGSPPIDHEDVLIMHKLPTLPEGQWQVEAIVSSPPFSERHAYKDEARNVAHVEKLKATGQIGGSRGLHKPSGEHPDNLAQLPTGEPPKGSS